MMPTTSQYSDRKFIEEVVGEDMLQKTVDWIAKEMEPEDVFSEQQLEAWARTAGFVDPSELPRMEG